MGDRFYTPAGLARRIVATAIEECRSMRFERPRMLTALEPSAGAGALVQALLWRGCIVLAYDTDRAACETAAWCWSADAPWPEVLIADFLSVPPVRLKSGDPLDMIVANPPYSDGQDGDHLEAMLGWMEPQTLLAAHLKLAALSTPGRYKRIWSRLDIVRLSICCNRPRYGGPDNKGIGGQHEMCTVFARLRDGREDPAKPPPCVIEHWLLELDEQEDEKET
jgi:methylase of polypeptide subunit release factors